MTKPLLSTFKTYEQKYGPWVSHNIEYAPGLFTRSEMAPTTPGQTAVQAAQWLERFLPKSWSESTILDLGCLEGGFSLHFAALGAKAVGLEVRENNLGRCRFLNQAFPELPLEFIQGDVTAVSVETHGRYDAIFLS